MTWFYFVLASGILVSVTHLLEKKLLDKEHALEFSGVIAILNALFTAPILFFIDYSSIDLTAIILLFFVSILAAIGFVLMAKSTRHMEVSSVSPMGNLSTGVTAILAFVFLGEALSLMQILGILMLIVGSYILQTHHAKSVLEPIKEFVNSKYLHFILIAIFCYALASLFDRFALSRDYFTPFEYLALVQIFISLNYLIFITIFYDGWHGIKKGFVNMGWWAVLISLMTVLHRVLGLLAIQIAYAGLVVAVKHSSSFFTVLLAGELFHEKNIKRKLFASLILIVGVVLIVI